MECIVKDHYPSTTCYPPINLALYQEDCALLSCLCMMLDCLTGYLTHHLDNGHFIAIVYLDFQKPFDTVPH